MLDGEESEESEESEIYYRVRVENVVLGEFVDMAIGCFLPPVTLQVIVITTFPQDGQCFALGGNT